MQELTREASHRDPARTQALQLLKASEAQEAMPYLDKALVHSIRPRSVQPR